VSSDSFEQARRMQEQINKLYGPTLKYLKQFDAIYKNEQRQQQFELVNKAQTFFLEQSRFFQESLNPFLKSMAYQQEFLKQTRIPEALVQRMSEWQSIIGKINYPAILGATVPEEIYASLDELAYELEGRIDTSSDLSANLTVVASGQSEKHSLTWNELLPYLFTLLSIIAMYHINYMNGIQQDNSHKELMNELKHQTAVEERVLSVKEERSRIDPEQASRQKDLEDKLDILMKSIKPLISENPSVSENGQ